MHGYLVIRLLKCWFCRSSQNQKMLLLSSTRNYLTWMM